MGQHVGRPAGPRDTRADIAAKSRCGDHRCAPRIGEGTCIGRLVIVDRARQWHEDRGPAGNRQLGDRGCTGTGDHQVRRGEPRGHVGEERSQLGCDAGLLIGRAYPRQVLGTTLLHDGQTRAQAIG